MARTVFKTAAFVRSATLPVPDLPGAPSTRTPASPRLTKGKVRRTFV